MNQDIEKFLQHIQETSPLKFGGHVEYHWKEIEANEAFCPEVFQSWFPDYEEDFPELESVTIDDFCKQLAIVFWSCFGWPGKKPSTTQAQQEFLLLLSENYDLSDIKSSLVNENDGFGEIYFEICNGGAPIVAAISWAAD